MDQAETAIEPNFVELTAEVVAAYVTHNAVQKSEIGSLIESVHASLKALGRPAPAPEPERPVPAVPIKKSLANDYIISLEDGRQYKSLRRHLSGRGMTPEQYRERWGLPSDYPMVAPSYAKQRSELAKSMGLGRQRRKGEEDAAPTEEAPAPAAKARRGKAAAA